MAIHIRRGDYVTHSATAQNRGLCSLKYYCAAIEQVLPHTVKPYFFHVFGRSCLDSQEPFAAWSCNLRRPQWSGHCVSRSAPDFSLRSSNYSQRQLQLVGGWLNWRLNKIVVSPKRWFVDPDSTRSLTPDD